MTDPSTYHVIVTTIVKKKLQGDIAVKASQIIPGHVYMTHNDVSL